MDYNIIEKLMKQMSDSNLTRLELEEDGLRISMEKSNKIQETVKYVQATDDQSGKVHMMDTSYEDDVQKEIKGSIQEETKYFIKSPIVGTFYESSSPETKAFVKVGDYVEKGQVLCIIESMKLMNEIESDVAGEVTAILVSNEEMVEYGQKMFAIEPR